jgi:hypothetical protein
MVSNTKASSHTKYEATNTQINLQIPVTQQNEECLTSKLSTHNLMKIKKKNHTYIHI